MKCLNAKQRPLLLQLQKKWRLQARVTAISHHQRQRRARQKEAINNPWVPSTTRSLMDCIHSRMEIFGLKWPPYFGLAPPCILCSLSFHLLQCVKKPIRKVRMFTSIVPSASSQPASQQGMMKACKPERCHPPPRNHVELLSTQSASPNSTAHRSYQISAVRNT